MIPAIFMNYYPALYLLDKPDPFGMPVWVRFLAPAAGLAARLEREGYSAAVINPRFVKPLDREMLAEYLEAGNKLRASGGGW